MRIRPEVQTALRANILFTDGPTYSIFIQKVNYAWPKKAHGWEDISEISGLPPPACQGHTALGSSLRAPSFGNGVDSRQAVSSASRLHLAFLQLELREIARVNHDASDRAAQERRREAVIRVHRFQTCLLYQLICECLE